MKKLLSILAAVGLTATASTSVVACGSSSKKDSENKDGTSTILSNNIIGDIKSDAVMQHLLEKHQWSQVYGDPGTAATSFMNYFAEAFMKYIATTDKDTLLKDFKANGAMPYVDDGMIDTIKTDWNTRNSSAQNDWTTAISNAKSQYGKKWEDKFFKDLQGQFGKSVVDKNGNSHDATSYADYKQAYISNSIMNGSSTGNTSSLFTSLKDDIYLWGKTPTGQDVDVVVANLGSQLFGTKIKVGDTTIDFKGSTSKGTTALTTDRKASWFGQMDNLLTYLKGQKAANAKLGGDYKTLLDDVVDLYNATGGLNAKAATGPTDTTAQTVNNFQVSQVQWATEDNVIDHFSSDINSASNELVQRWDTNYQTDFVDGTSTPDVANMYINANYNFKNKISYIFNGTNNSATGAQINGLFSNAQRFVANDYYKTERPVAVSEVVVSPIQSDKADYSQEIVNTGYTGNDVAMTDQLYRFIGNFINNKVDGKDTGGQFSSAKTDSTFTNSSNYSWDDLMTDGSNWDNDVSSTPATWSSDFTGKVKFATHSNLLTLDSSDSDYSPLLKNSIYDFLAKGTKAPQFNAAADWKSDHSKDNWKGQTALSGILSNNTNNGSFDPTTITNEYNAITGLIQSLSRTSTEKSMYQVVNPDQGIIAFMDKDGLHFVRVEGYGLLSTEKGNLLQDQTPLSTSQFEGDSAKDKSLQLDTSKSDTEKADYNAAMSIDKSISNASNPTTASQAATITSDYLDAQTDKKNTVGVSYKDLNKSFGNKYLQFLANTSIPKSVGYSSPKYSYDLNSLLKTYIGGDISTDNLESQSTMTMMVWNYAKTLLGFANAKDKGDSELFDQVIKGSLASDAMKNTINNAKRAGWSLALIDDFKNDYKKYIVDDILGKYTDNSRESRAEGTYTTNLQSADQAIEETIWKDKHMVAYNPNLTWAKALGQDGKPNATYAKEWADMSNTNIWAVDSSSKAKVSSGQPGSHIAIENGAYSYDVTMSEFIPNEYAMKGDVD